MAGGPKLGTECSTIFDIEEEKVERKKSWPGAISERWDQYRRGIRINLGQAKKQLKAENLDRS